MAQGSIQLSAQGQSRAFGGFPSIEHSVGHRLDDRFVHQQHVPTPVGEDSVVGSLAIQTESPTSLLFGEPYGHLVRRLFVGQLPRKTIECGFSYGKHDSSSLRVRLTAAVRWAALVWRRPTGRDAFFPNLPESNLLIRTQFVFDVLHITVQAHGRQIECVAWPPVVETRRRLGRSAELWSDETSPSDHSW